ncbi:ATPase central domain-containing protein [Calothrix parasitica NIES-267]|uniref:ATPase central domain-containing protein n=1 Tax=Calothrix parasitica NIES-267 TaxID=1973488 RepID=A0A1Z4LK07_9CYAN|nr:ATPase central domain-containing protein [Calothrix parasitica NIES-267]
MDNWQSLNYQYLTNAIAIVGEALYHRARSIQNQSVEASSDVLSSFEVKGQENVALISASSNLENICTIFHLSDFERDLLLLCTGMELNPGWTSWCAVAQDNPKLDYPTFNLALSILKNPDWNALNPAASLRRWGLIEIGNSHILTIAPLRINERILHYLMGVSHLDEELIEIVEVVEGVDFLVDSHQLLVEQIRKTWLNKIHSQTLPIIQLCGGEIASKRNIAATACNQLGLNLYSINLSNIPANIDDIHRFIRLWKREYLLNKSVLFLECSTASSDTNKENAINLLIDKIISPIVISTEERRVILHRPAITFDVYKPTAKEQRNIWNQALKRNSFHINGFVDTLISQFNLSSNAIEAVSINAIGYETTDVSTLENQLWDTCRIQARPQLDDLAQRILPATAWDDLVLPLPQRQTLQEIVSHVRQRAKVYENWGFSTKGSNGLGVTALFAGTSGTGKTMAASVLARELNLDLYRIDLSSVVSKYIGETEKNLRRVFDAAEAGGVILLFDEADALFGKRSDVKDSRDRYANMEVSYLLQRMEAYRGLAILTTNLKDSIDTAFMRRIRFIVKFPFPDANQRAEIWQRIFPKDTPSEGLNIKKLAKLNVAGGNIRNIALNAAFLAADEQQPVMMKHLLQAAESEYIKLERTLTDAEKLGWV